MDSSQGPRPLPKKRLLSARIPPVETVGPPPEIWRRYLRTDSLRRAPSASPRRPGVRITPDTIDQSLAAVARGEAVNVSSPDCDLTVRIAPAAREVIQGSGLGPEGRE